MLGNILNVSGAQRLSKNEQGIINGGKATQMACQVGCQNLNENDLCYAAANCKLCGSCVQGVCEPR